MRRAHANIGTSAELLPSNPHPSDIAYGAKRTYEKSMLWMLLIYVVASNGYNGQPALSSSFHGATFPNRESCEAAARTLSTYSTPGTDDIAKAGLITVCAPVLPSPPVLVSPKPATELPTEQQPQFPSFPPPKRVSH
jgi:hypothetical protein